MGHQKRIISLPGLIAIAQATRADDSWAMHQIICRFKPLARRLARATRANVHLQDDLENAAYLALVKAVRRHDSKRAGFPAFAEIYMRGAVWREHARWIGKQGAEGADLAPIDPSPSESVEEVVHERLAPWGRRDIAQAVAGLSSNQRNLLERRYVDDAPLALIAADGGTSSSAVSQRLRTIHQRVAKAIAA
jgi:RNA polymerase sigma factor (sigma-70 family)